MNPVWKRELRARWRDWRAFALVFFMVAVLAGIFVWQYGENTHYLAEQEYSDPRRRLSLLGHNLFALLAWLQTVLWMLLAPVLTATAISTEREKGLLEGLQLSHLRAGQIVFGKLLSSLSLIALLIAVTLPITATCFLMGGVSPGEFLLVLALHIATAICCAAIGLAISAWCRNSMTAIALSIVAVCLWSGLDFVALIAAFNGLNGRAGPPAWPWNQAWEIAGKTHPMMAVIETAGVVSGSSTIPWTTTTPSWMVSLIFMLAITTISFFIAAWGTRRILLNPFRIERQRLRKLLHATDATNLERSAAPIQKPKNKNKRWELGALARMQFSNPVLGREVRACFRPRSTSIAMLILAGVLVPLAALAYLQVFYWALFNPQMIEGMGPIMLGIYLSLAIVLPAILGASAFSREREGGTWEALQLSLLSPREVLWGKMGAPLSVCVVCGIVFLPIILPGVGSVVYSGPYHLNGISLTQLIAALSIIFSSAWCCTLLGLLISHFSKRSVTAICWTLGVLLIALVFMPAFLNEFSSQMAEEVIQTWHPFFAFVNLFDRRVRYDINENQLPVIGTFASALPCVLLMLFIGAICFLVLWRKLYSSKTSDSR